MSWQITIRKNTLLVSVLYFLVVGHIKNKFKRKISLNVLAPPNYATKGSSSNNLRYSAASIYRNYIDNVEMKVKIGIKNLPQDSFVILGMVQLVAQRLFIP